MSECKMGRNIFNIQVYEDWGLVALKKLNTKYSSGVYWIKTVKPVLNEPSIKRNPE
jgi:hypothetical protein